jgi:hypothetical protein
MTYTSGNHLIYLWSKIENIASFQTGPTYSEYEYQCTKCLGTRRDRNFLEFSGIQQPTGSYFLPLKLGSAAGLAKGCAVGGVKILAFTTPYAVTGSISSQQLDRHLDILSYAT